MMRQRRALSQFFYWLGVMMAVAFSAPSWSETTSGELDSPKGITVAENTEGESNATAATAPPAETLSTTASTPAAASGQKLFGQFEIRPSWTMKVGEFHTEDTAELGYQFNPGFKLGYLQYFNTNIYNPALGHSQNLGLVAEDGYAEAKFKDLWVSADKKWTFSTSHYLYMPSFAGSRDAGMVTRVRNYLNLRRKFSEK